MRSAGPIEAFVALGSNLGDSRRILEEASIRLQEFSATPIRRSSLWRSSPVDCPPGSPDFLNAVAALVPLPGETPETLLTKLQGLEAAFGRTPKVVTNDPRPLDLDIIAFGSEVRNSEELVLPHPRAIRRAFVLLPLAEIAPTLVLPGQALNIRGLAERLHSSHDVQRWE
jgi:2-amino-4-hydroxy-6-hydroxymethyldihydropteridine diphosphokinase